MRNGDQVLCNRNDDFPASLEIGKRYLLISDDEAEKHGQLRIIDESGEDYLYPKEYFASIDSIMGDLT